MDYRVKFEIEALKQFEYFLKHDMDIAIKIEKLLEDIKLHPYSGIGKPEMLRHSLKGYWSRRINKEHRLIYRIEDNAIIIIYSCRFHC